MSNPQSTPKQSEPAAELYGHVSVSEHDTSKAEISGIRIKLKSGRWIEIDDIDLIRVDDDSTRQMIVLWSEEIRYGC